MALALGSAPCVWVTPWFCGPEWAHSALTAGCVQRTIPCIGPGAHSCSQTFIRVTPCETSREIIALTHRQDWSKGPAIKHLTSSQKLSRNSSSSYSRTHGSGKKAAISGVLSKSSVFLINFWVLEKPVGVDGWISPRDVWIIFHPKAKRKMQYYFS